MVLTPSYIPFDGPNMLFANLARVHRRLSAIYLIMARMLLPQGKRFGICILFTHPTAILDSLLYLSEEIFIPAIAERFALLPRVSWSAKYVVLRTLHSHLGISIRVTSTNSSRQRKNIWFTSRGRAHEGRD